MLRLLQKFWGARNRSNDTARSPSSRRSCRLQVEALEDRLTPSLSLSFFPIAHVSVNPQPLPPGSGNEVMFPGVYLEEVPLVGTPVPGVTTEHETLTGVLSKQVLLQTDPSASPSLWSLELFYSEKVSATENFVPPSAFNAGSFAATFSMTGSVAAVLTSANPLQPTFRMTLKLVETGGVSWTQPGTPPQETATLAWTALITENGTETPFFPPGSTTIPPGPSLTPMTFLANTGSVGNEVIVSFEEGDPDRPLITAWFTLQDQVTATFMPVPLPGQPPGPSLQISALFSTAGSVTDKVLIPATAFTPEVDTGTVQYTDSLMETIMLGDGSIRSVMESSQNSGIFIIAVLVG